MYAQERIGPSCEVCPPMPDCPIFLPMITRRQISLSGFALATAFLLTHPQAAPGQDLAEFTYWLDIDCGRRGILNEGTRSLYSIVGILDDGEEYSFTPDDPDDRRLTEEDCRNGVAPFTVSLPEPVNMRHIRIELLEGQYMDDALFLDFLRFTVRGPDLEDSIEWDVDGGAGWCLSADADDSQRQWRENVYDDQCYPCLEFSLIPSTTDGQPIIDGDWVETALPAYSECPSADSSGS